MTTLYEDPDLIALVKSKRLRGLNYVQRRGEHPIIKRDRIERPDWRRPLGRPRLRWAVQVLGDLGRRDSEQGMSDRGGKKLVV